MIDGILFDKDGTLFDFAATWDHWAGGLIDELSAGDGAVADRMAETMRYDLGRRAFRPDSVIIAGTNREAAELITSALPGADVDAVEDLMTRRAAVAPQRPAADLPVLLGGLRARGLALGVMTNDTEFAARAHLTRAEVFELFDFVAGFDSGHGAKPDPAPLLAFARATGKAPGRIAMVGDSTHDMIAGRAAGMICIGVLTGPATTVQLAPFADVVLPDIGHLPAWLDRGAPRAE
ncbi:HAD-IA family hydrolase [Pseudooceanicola sp. 216_PA32_1]|uniref:phosphoglycolate phosphatase n=1 Tax=Pseudooceanicola pacificus TaxID=2676438 RepID=A0A844W517_9RHOB|nr:HAD family hydrolase [Pseudooceanicola pacificus]MWB78937.1 HAD-IA family hydrolase [Pseudooceanicola pacificus]